MGHPDFRAGGRIFASLSPDATTGNVKLTLEQQQALLAAEPAAFRPCSGAWGRSGWTTILLAAATRPVIASALELAHENVMSQPARKVAAKKKASSPGPKTSTRKAATKKPGPKTGPKKS